MHGHLVAIKVGIESLAHERVDSDRVSFNKHGFECLNAHAMEGRRTIEKYGMILGDLLENVPNLFVLALQHFLSGLDGIRVTQLFEAANDERLKQFKGDLFRQTTLVQLQLGTDNDD